MTLTYFDPKKITILVTDAPTKGLEAIVLQKEGNEEKLIACASRTLMQNEKDHAVIDLEASAIILGFKRFSRYLQARKFIIRVKW